MKERMDVDVTVGLFALSFMAVGENLSNAINDCTDTIKDYIYSMEACETVEDREKLEAMRPFVVAMKNMTVAFSDSIKTTEKEDKLIREIIDELRKDD